MTIIRPLLYKTVNSSRLLLTSCIVLALAYSLKYLEHSLTLVLIITTARVTIAILLSLTIVLLFLLWNKLTGRPYAARDHILLTSRVSLLILALMVSVSIGTSLPAWLASSF